MWNRGRGGRGGGDRKFQPRSYGDPNATLVEMGVFKHSCEGEMVVQSTNTQVPHFNAQIFSENKAALGRVEEVFGPLSQVYFSVKCETGVKADSFRVGDKVMISSDKLLPIERFIPKDKPSKAPKRREGGGQRGAPRGRGGPFRGGSRGAPRGRGGRGSPRGSFRGKAY